MKKYRFELGLAVLLLANFAGVWWWLTPGAGSKLTRSEVDEYLRQIEPNVPFESAEKAEFLARMRAWGESDDGAPVYMLNLMRLYRELKRFPGAEVIKVSPKAANAYYEDKVMPLLARLGGYPLVGGETASLAGGDGRMHSNLLEFDPALDDWSRVLVVRYPSRRAFFDLIRDPEYLKLMPYKVASLKVALVPVSAEAVVPDPRFVVGALGVIAFLGIGWIRSARRR